jgi:signal transduction histidine kinase
MSLNRISTIRIFWLAGFFTFFLCLHAQAQKPGDYIVLDGSHKFSSDDNPVYSSPDYDDSQWKSITVPGSWQSQNIKTEKGIGWYRISFNIPEDFKHKKPALFLGRIGDADEVFLNGVKIGGEGLIDKRFVEATKVERLYSLPENILKYNNSNLISIRVINTYLNGGIFDKGVAIGDYNLLLVEKFKRDKYILVLEFCFLTFFSLFFITCLFFYMKGLRDREYMYFWLFTLLYGVLFIFGSVSFYNAGLKTPLIQQVITFISAMLPLSIILLLNSIYQKKLTLYFKLFVLLFPLSSLALVLFPDYTSRVFLYNLWRILFFIAAFFMIFQAIKAYYNKINESGPILLGITGLIVGFVLESIGGLDLLQITGFFLWDYAVVFFMICVMYALAARYTRIKDELRTASLKIFEAHEDERKRLARELHDGVGQSLLSVKLRLKMLESKMQEGISFQREDISALISDISFSIDEIRAAARDLRPSFLESTDFIEAIQWHAKKIQEQTGINIKVNIKGLLDVDLKVKENIYRIYQEALSNIVKHSGARNVEVDLKVENNKLFLRVKDDGKGFALLMGRREDTGLGLHTIKERVDLLGGILNIKSSDKIGTSIEIEVPVK